MTSLYDFKLKSITGELTDLAKYRGKVCLVVNVASQCGYTKQYKGLEELYRKYKDRGLVVLGVPSNDFGAQEPGSDAEILNFCSTRYDVTFDMFSKVPVKGAQMVDLYKYLTESTNNQVQWNFNKFLVNKEGEVVKYFPSSVAPDSPELVQAIEVLL